MTSDSLLVPVQLEAFVLNPAVCGQPGDGNARICPITQPNYTFLRFNDFVAQNDVQGHADLHNTTPAKLNSRMTDLGTYPGKFRRNRHGVYLHWTLPRAYRAGVSLTDSVPKARRDEERLKRGLPEEVPNPSHSESATPNYIQPPTRWLVVRRIAKDTIRPESARDSFREYEAWVIESDFLWKLDDIPAHYDLQVDVSPFILGGLGGDVDIREQAEVFIGRKTPLQEWDSNSQVHHVNLSLLGSSNQLFADFQMHNSNVFSMVDNFQYGDPAKPEYLEAAHADYYVVGWHRGSDVDPLWMQNDPLPHKERLDGLFMSLNGSKEWLNAHDPVRLLCHGAMYKVEWDHQVKPKHVPADNAAGRLQDAKLPAVSIGTHRWMH